MVKYIHVVRVIRDHFRPFRFGISRELNKQHVLVFLIIPAIVGGSLAFWRPMGARSQQITFITIYAVLAAVMTSLLPVVQGVIGFSPIDENRHFAEEERWIWNNKVFRLEVLRELYAEIAVAVLLLVVSMGPLLIAPAEILPNWVVGIISWFAYGVGVAVAVSTLHIIVGVYRILDMEAAEADKILRRNGPPAETRDRQV